MPELPEVETVVRSLRPMLIGKTIAAVKLGRHRLRQPWQEQWNTFVAGSSMIDVTRRGKWILIELSQQPHRLVVHLGMTGRLYLQKLDDELTQHTHLIFPLRRTGEELRFIDPRRFGSVTLAKAVSEQHRFPQEAALGPEPFDVTRKHFAQKVLNSKRPVKSILLDQSVLAGVGNIYADESLYVARIHPERKGIDLSTRDITALRKAIVEVLQRAIEAKGSTIVNFYYGDNESGAFQNEFRVYGRTDEPCFRCQRPITRILISGRSTHFCQACQR